MCRQILDTLIYEGNKFPLRTDTLRSCWTETNPPPPQGYAGTANYRGYYSTWEIIDNCLCLADLSYFSPGGYRGINYVFPEEAEKIKATWYTGDLEIYRKEQIDVLYSQFLVILDPQWVISIENGNYAGQCIRLISDYKLQKPDRKFFGWFNNRTR